MIVFSCYFFLIHKCGWVQIAGFNVIFGSKKKIWIKEKKKIFSISFTMKNIKILNIIKINYKLVNIQII